jgi:hypothetical protein
MLFKTIQKIGKIRLSKSKNYIVPCLWRVISKSEKEKNQRLSLINYFNRNQRTCFVSGPKEITTRKFINFLKI